MPIIENFILLGISLLIILLRLYARLDAVGWKGLATDDYLMVLIAFTYAALTATTHFSLVQYQGLANSDMTPDQRASLAPESKEYQQRVFGSKLELVERIVYTIVLWLTKVAMLVFSQRLTSRLGAYTKRIRFGFGLLGVTWLVDFLVTLLACRPLHKNWQINPDPGDTCYPATSLYSLFGTLSLNVITSLYVFIVPLPVLWMANIKLWKKIGLILLVSANCFVIVVAILRGYWTVVDARQGAREASRWAYRVCFVAVTTTNLPLIFPLVRRMIAPMIKRRHRTQRDIRTITVWERARLAVAGEIPDESETKWLPACCEDSCLTGSTAEDSRVDTGIDLGSIDVEMYGHPGRHKRERMIYENQ
ncbi:hypothetical protein F5Y11DRAFT_346966 [Daldinia sp. FL1419]|nr:hypothetical protein F5Y11DRAFT_346966 [Daldinia sp. FL1419]